MGINFPNTPTTGQIYPTSGTPQYRWDGEKWSQQSVQQKAVIYADGSQPMTGQLTLITPPVAATDAASKSYVDSVGGGALAYSGMQINGSMEISQEGGYGGRALAGGYICDGWGLYKTGSMAMTSGTSSAANVAGISYTLFSAVTTAQPSLAAGDIAFIYQKIEGWRTARLGWGGANAQPLTIAFWSGHQRTGLYSVSFMNGASNRSYVASYTQNAAGVFQYNVITIPGDVTGNWPPDYTGVLQISFPLAAGTNGIAPAANTWAGNPYYAVSGQVNAVGATSDAFRITGVVVLPGTQAPTAAQSPLIMRPYDQELLTCRRYFRSYGGAMIFEVLATGQALSATTAQSAVYFDPPFRAAPTVAGIGNIAMTSATGAPAAISAISIASASTTSAMIQTTASGLVAGSATNLIANNDLNARLKLDARL